MIDRTITARPLSQEAFAPFGSVIDKTGAEPRPMNAGRARRFHDLAAIWVAGDGSHVVVGIVEAEPYTMPINLSLVERHPLGAQTFMPLNDAPFLVMVCPDEDGRPGRPQAFVTATGQGVNYAMNVWHGVLTPFGATQEFVVIDRGGPGLNLQEYVFAQPWTIILP